MPPLPLGGPVPPPPYLADSQPVPGSLAVPPVPPYPPSLTRGVPGAPAPAPGPVAALVGSGMLPPNRATALSGFEDNPYTLNRRAYVGPPPTQKKTRRPVLRALVAAVVLGGAGFAAYRLTHPSPHRSAPAVATSFYDALQRGSLAAAAADVEPQQQTTASAALGNPSVRHFVQSQLSTAVVQVGTTTVEGSETSVIIELCRANLSCGATVPVPTVRIAGAWYVDWNTWLQALPPVLSPAP